MITRIRIKNFRSFVEAEVSLKPFSLVVGANGSGKSNLLRFFQELSGPVSQAWDPTGRNREIIFNQSQWVKHRATPSVAHEFDLELTDGIKIEGRVSRQQGMLATHKPLPWQGNDLPIFNLDPVKIAAVETAIPNAQVQGSGMGTAQVLDTLKNGDREDLFDAVESNFRLYVPEAEKLSLRTVEDGRKQIQVRERGLSDGPTIATELSEGTRLVLAILTILHQEKPPAVILLEDVDRGMHPGLFRYFAPLMRDIAERNDVNILATTHNPYLVDCFQDNKEAVIIVEKKDGASTLTTLADRLVGLDYESVDPDDMPLGNLWFSGFVGGVPNPMQKTTKS